MKKFLFIILATFIFCGCADKSSSLETDENTRNEQEDADTGMWKSPYFITEYVEVSKISVGSSAPNHFYLAADGNVHYLDPLTDNITEEAKYFAELYGDTQYDGYVHPGLHSALAYPIDKITISCEQDFDANHPAGKPLDDVIKLDYKTYYKFVKSGYTAYNYTNPQYMNPDEEWHVLNLDKINADNTKLMDISLSAKSIAGIKFDSKPEVPGEYTFNLAVTINGEVMTTSFTTTFE